MKQLSKDQIKDRLLKRAAKHWGYTDVELENVFDPIVNLLFDVCAKELEKISDEVFSSRRRITERLIEVLTPTISAKATAARGILRAYPIEDEAVLNDHHQFCFQRKEVNPYNPVSVNFDSFFFGPAKLVKLNRNKIDYVILPNGIQEVVSEQFKEILPEKKYLKPIPHSTIWLGLKHEGNGTIRDLMFYFYLKNIHNRNTFFHFLHRAKWFLNDVQLNSKKGYNNETRSSKKENELLQNDFYHIDKIQEHISNYYKDHFVTITDTVTLDESHYAIPKEFQDIIPSENLQKLSEQNLLWIKIEFPNVIGYNYLSEIFCSNNCFPIINKKLNEAQGNIRDILNIYPLTLNNEYFLELFSVLNDKNKEIDIVNSNENLIDDDDDYAFLRFGGISRFDERNATEEINYLIDLVKDEASAFSRFGNEFADTNLKQVNQIISRLRNKIAEVSATSIHNPYLVFNSKNKSTTGTLFVRYWTTDGEKANKINIFSKLTLEKGVDFDKDFITLMSITQGGKNELSNSEKIYAYRENLISNQRIVTRQDIIILCKNHYGDMVDRIEIKNGIQTSLDSNVGYTPTIDIYLERKNLEVYNEEEWEFLRLDFKLLVESRAINIVPFRVFYES